MNLFLLLFTCLNVLNNVDYTITYFLQAPSVVPMWTPSCSTYPSYGLVPLFIQFYLYLLLKIGGFSLQSSRITLGAIK